MAENGLYIHYNIYKDIAASLCSDQKAPIRLLLQEKLAKISDFCLMRWCA